MVLLDLQGFYTFRTLNSLRKVISNAFCGTHIVLFRIKQPGRKGSPGYLCFLVLRKGRASQFKLFRRAIIQDTVGKTFLIDIRYRYAFSSCFSSWKRNP